VFFRVEEFTLDSSRENDDHVLLVNVYEREGRGNPVRFDVSFPATTAAVHFLHNLMPDIFRFPSVPSKQRAFFGIVFL
jgi:hypothetical protein